MTKIYPVLMVGGSGTRLWPLSRKDTPKQFQRIISEHSLFQDTILRLNSVGNSPKAGLDFAAPIIVGAEAYLDLIKEQLLEIEVTPTAIILEPCARSTTPVAAVAARFIATHDPEAAIILLPSDHHISQADVFRDAIGTALSPTKEGLITVFGITPTHPETGFGYIRSGESIAASMQRVTQFTEKPNAATALSYLQDPAYTWNSGIFMFAPDTMLSELEAHAPKTLCAVTKALSRAQERQGGLLLEEVAFSKCENIPLDISIMEKTSRAAVFSPLSCGWSDVGTWQAIADLTGQPTSADSIVSIDNENCYIRTDDKTLVTALGLKDIAIIAHEGSVLILPKNRSQDVGKIVAALKQKNRDDRL